MGAVTKAYKRKGFLIIWGNAQIFSLYMRKSLVVYDFAPDLSKSPNIWGKFLFSFLSVWLCNRSQLNFLIYEENFVSFFISAFMCSSKEELLRISKLSRILIPNADFKVRKSPRSWLKTAWRKRIELSVEFGKS